MITLDPPRWKNGPKICSHANLPALPTERDLDKFLASNGPRCNVDYKWCCQRCGMWHALTSGPDPSGGSSGTGRSKKA